MLIQSIAGVLIVICFGPVTIRLVRRALATRSRPIVWLACGFTLSLFSLLLVYFVTLYLGLTTGDPSATADVHPSLRWVAGYSYMAGLAGFILFVRTTFSPHSRGALLLAAACVATLFGAETVVLLREAHYIVHPQFSSWPTRLPYMAAVTVTWGWMATQAFTHWRTYTAHPGDRDPFVIHRFLLLSIGPVFLLISSIIANSLLENAHPMHQPAGPVLLSLGCMAAFAVCSLLAFSPPAFYRRWIRARANGGDSTGSVTT